MRTVWKVFMSVLTLCKENFGNSNLVRDEKLCCSYCLIHGERTGAAAVMLTQEMMQTLFCSLGLLNMCPYSNLTALLFALQICSTSIRAIHCLIPTGGKQETRYTFTYFVTLLCLTI